MITIVDYGLGNLGSIANMIKKIGGKSVITSDLKAIAKSRKLILPGVGAFDNGMENLARLKLIQILNIKALKEKIPVLGICLGLQLLTENSDEGRLKGLSWIRAKTVKFDFAKDKETLRIPHMGWNTVSVRKKSRLFDNMPDEPRFYFVHSYYVSPNVSRDILTTTEYGGEFASSIEHENIYGTQFHPEKSHRYGMKLLENFLNIPC